VPRRKRRLATRNVRHGDTGANLQVAGAIDRQGHLLADQGRILAAGEGQHRAVEPSDPRAVNTKRLVSSPQAKS
jgi:hypothetical protein